MNKQILLVSILVILSLLVLPLVLADTETYQINQNVDLRFTCTSNGAIPSAAATFNITVNYPNGSTFINNKKTTTLGNGAFNYTLMFRETGLYKVQMFCVDGSSSYSNEGYYDITPTGKIQTSISNNPILIVLGIIGIGLIIFGVVKGLAWLGFIGSIMIILLGVYTMIYGFNNTIDMYTRGTALIFVGLGIIFMFASAYDWAFGGGDE
jgi:hypothetical protein